MRAKFDAAIIEINNIIEKDNKAEVLNRSYMCEKDDYKDTVNRIKEILEL
jgi:hypothetical protein